MFKEFKEFAVKGNAMDMAVGIIIGGAFGTIVNSLVKDIIMPPIGLLMGNIDFKDLFIVLKEAPGGGVFNTIAQAQEAGAVTLNIGVFINSVIAFLIVAFAMFILVKNLNRLREPDAPAPSPEMKKCPYCLTDVAKKATRCPNCTSALDPVS